MYGTSIHSSRTSSPVLMVPFIKRWGITFERCAVTFTQHRLRTLDVQGIPCPYGSLRRRLSRDSAKLTHPPLQRRDRDARSLMQLRVSRAIDKRLHCHTCELGFGVRDRLTGSVDCF